MRRMILAFFIVLFSFNSGAAEQNASFVQRKDVQKFIDKMVKKHHFNRQELTATLSEVTLQPKIIQSMEKPYEKKNWDAYKKLFLTSNRVESGVKFWKENSITLQQAEKKYGVPANIIVAIIGIETLYGKIQGNYKVIDSLSTLSFNYPKRSAFFTKELEEYLILCKEHGVSPHTYNGSYAGAMGKPQFMPSSYRAYAANFNNKVKKDLMNDNQAVIASVANYFHKHGWNPRQGIAQPAMLENKAQKNLKTNSRNPDYLVSQLKDVGIKPVTAAVNMPKKAGIIELDTEKGAEYWLAYPNFYVITRYNHSPQYAMAVYLLSQQLKNQWAKAYEQHKFAYA